MQLPAIDAQDPGRPSSGKSEPDRCRTEVCEPERQIDSLTAVPQSLYEALLQAGQEVRKLGQHVLVAGKRGPGKLVHRERCHPGALKSKFLGTLV